MGISPNFRIVNEMILLDPSPLDDTGLSKWKKTLKRDFWQYVALKIPTIQKLKTNSADLPDDHDATNIKITDLSFTACFP